MVTNGIAQITNLTTKFKKQGYTSVIAVSQESVSDNFKFIATGDQHGNILLWNIDEYLIQDRPSIHLKYKGQVFDLKFIQSSDDQQSGFKSSKICSAKKKEKVNCMLSLHSTEGSISQIIVTSLRDFKITRIVKLPFHARSMELARNESLGYQVYVTSAFEKACVNAGYQP